jgi:hypothetical protein
VLTVVNPPTVVSFNVLFGSQSYNVIGTTRTRLPWQITGIQVVFSNPMVTGNLKSIGGVTATNFAGLGTNTLTWTISPIAQGTFPTTLTGVGPNALTDSQGIPLGGGAGFVQTLNVLWADINDDGVVNAADIALVNDAIPQTYDIFADLNGDLAVNLNDVQIARQRIGTTLSVSLTSVLTTGASPTFQPISGVSFTMPVGGPNPLPQSLTVASTGSDFAFGEALTTVTGGNWLQSSGSGCGCNTPQSLTLSVNGSGLTAGTYTGQIVFFNGNVLMSVPVTLTVTGPTNSTPIIQAGGLVKPAR